jgi:hypothetical protein
MIKPPTTMALALRDPAAAALFGVLGGPGATFGNESHAGVGQDLAGFGDDSGVGGYYGYGRGGSSHFGADPTMPPMAPPGYAPHPMHHGGHHGGHQLHPDVQKVWDEHHKRKHHQEQREKLLDPNAGSPTKVERYDFSLSQDLTLSDDGSEAADFTDLNLQPSVTIRPQRASFNAPAAGYFIVSSIQVANVNALVGGATDAFIYGPQSQGIHLDLPTLTPANRLQVGGSYNGFLPNGYTSGQDFMFVATFQGPATVVA